MTTSAERRARRRWQVGRPIDPLESTAERLSVLFEGLTALHQTTSAIVGKAALGVLSEAEREALARWAVPAGGAFARAAEDLRRLDVRLRQIVDLNSGDRPVC